MRALLVLALLSSSSASANWVSDDCGDYETDIRAVIWNIADDWEDFEDFLEDYSGRSVTSLENDFAKGNDDGNDVTCDDYYGPDYDDIDYGVGWMFGFTVFLYETFLFYNELFAGTDASTERSCLAGLLTATFASTNLASIYKQRDLAEAAFEYWKDRFGSDHEEFYDCPTVEYDNNAYLMRSNRWP